jgi:Icc-related predicted phosphoesterase
VQDSAAVRVLLVSDLHYDLRKMDWVVARAADPAASIDVVVLAGDLLDIANSVPLDAQITVVLSYLERLASSLPTVVCSGNHDLDHRTDSGEKDTRWLAEARSFGVVVDGDSLDIGDWRLTACAWWEGPETLAALEARLGVAASDRPANWAWAFHGPPEGPLSWTGSRHYGDPELPRLLGIHSPDVVLCGHIHQAPFTTEGNWSERRGETWLFNAGYQRGDEPTSIEVDLDARTASWCSAATRARIDLTGPRAQ